MTEILEMAISAIVIGFVLGAWAMAIGHTVLWWFDRRERSRSDIERWRRHRAQQHRRRS